jgi:hypothetical protein
MIEQGRGGHGPRLPRPGSRWAKLWAPTVYPDDWVSRQTGAARRPRLPEVPWSGWGRWTVTRPARLVFQAFSGEDTGRTDTRRALDSPGGRALTPGLPGLECLGTRGRWTLWDW